MDIGSRPGIARRPRAPTIRPVITSRMMKVIMRSDVPSPSQKSPAWDRPSVTQLEGRYVQLRRIRPDDAEPLFEAGRDPEIWTYLPYGPYESADGMRERLVAIDQSSDPLYFTVARGGVPEGVVSFLRIEPQHGVIEIGHVWFGTPLQRTPAATEAIFLLARYAFDELGYRRLEWKCNALNEKSRRAAERFGFSFEGVFRNHMVVKGRNRDTAWYAITAEDWPAIRAAFERWLDESNFAADGAQLTPLATS